MNVMSLISRSRHIVFLLTTFFSDVLSTYHSLFPEVDADRGDELWVEGAIGVLVEEAALADARVAKRQELDQEVVLPRGGGVRGPRVSHRQDGSGVCCRGQRCGWFQTSVVEDSLCWRKEIWNDFIRMVQVFVVSVELWHCLKDGTSNPLTTRHLPKHI